MDGFIIPMGYSVSMMIYDDLNSSPVTINNSNSHPWGGAYFGSG